MLKNIPGVVIASLLLAAPAVAQSYPAKPIRVIVPVPPGALTDIVTRRIAASAAPIMGQSWIVENRPGANLIAAAEACRRAPPDGYTLCVLSTSTLTFNPHLIDNLPYNAERDFQPVINLGMLIGGLVASPKLGVKNIDELRAMVLAKPGTFNFGTYGPSTSPNVFRHYISERWKTPIVEVPYTGANELVAALISGEIHMTWTALGNWADNPNDAKGRIVTLDASTRSAKIPDVPIYEEAGLGEYPVHTWIGMFAPAGTPAAVIERVNGQVAEAIRKPEISEYLANQLIEPRITSAKEFTDYVAGEREETGKLLRRFNIPKIN